MCHNNWTVEFSQQLFAPYLEFPTELIQIKVIGSHFLRDTTLNILSLEKSMPFGFDNPFDWNVVLRFIYVILKIFQLF